MFRSSFAWKLFVAQVSVIALTGAVLAIYGARRIENDELEASRNLLEGHAYLLAEIARPTLLGKPVPKLQPIIEELGRATGNRLTVVAVGGTVLADSDESPNQMDNHGSRPEVLEAKQRGVGAATRFSQTVQRMLMYVAVPIRDDKGIIGFARASHSLSKIEGRIAELRTTVFLVAAIAVALASVLALVFARRLTGRLQGMTEVARAMAGGDYARRVRTTSGDEIGMLARAFNTMAEQLGSRIEAMTNEQTKLASILRGMSEGVVAIDADERVLHINAVAAEYLQPPTKDPIGRPIWEITRQPRISEAASEAMAKATDVRRDATVTTSRGDRHLMIRSSPLRDSDGRLAGAVLVLNDVTELRQLERMRSEFVANVSHELKTPLTAIRGFIETLINDRDLPDDKRRHFNERIRKQTARLSALVTDLLTLSRVESQAPLSHEDVIDLRTPVRNSVNELRPLAEQKGLSLELDVPDSAVSLRGNAESLRQLVDNLVDNAIKYTPAPGKVRVSLGCIRGSAILEVSDTGPGIAPAELDRVFERFYRVDKGRSRDLGGTGLGLSIVKHVAISHGGKASVDSVLGEGSRFRVEFPVLTEASRN